MKIIIAIYVSIFYNETEIGIAAIVQNGDARYAQHSIIMISGDWTRRDRLCGAEGERKSSQANGLVHDETSKSAVLPHAEGATWLCPGNLSGPKTKAQNSVMGFCALFI